MVLKWEIPKGQNMNTEVKTTVLRVHLIQITSQQSLKTFCKYMKVTDL